MHRLPAASSFRNAAYCPDSIDDRLEARSISTFWIAGSAIASAVASAISLDDRLRRAGRREDAEEKLADHVRQPCSIAVGNVGAAFSVARRIHRQDADLAGAVEFQQLAGDVRRSSSGCGR